MDRGSISNLPMKAKIGAAMLVLIAPAFAFAYGQDEMATPASTTVLAAAETVPTQPLEGQSFEASFAPFKTIPDRPEIAPGAVDLNSFTPPTEVKPKPAPEPEGGAVIRSLGTKTASFYGKRFHGRLTANGERFNMNAMTAAHKTLPFGTKVRVTYPRNGRSIVVRINDRGPFIRGRAIDLSRGAAAKLGFISSGHARVRLDIVR
jgi:rare lipoprotein A